jgi:hypothetical protein
MLTETGRIGAAGGGALSTRASLRASIASLLSANHGHSFTALPADVQADYLIDADALIDKGMTPYWPDQNPPAHPSPALEAEVFEFDRSMEWFMSFLDARHPDWRKTAVYPSAHIDEADPVEWDAWVTISVAVSEQALRLWMQRFADQTGVPPVGERSPMAAVPPSAPPASRGVRRARTAAAIGAVLAHRHGRRWMDQPVDVKTAYLSDAYALIDAGLMYAP